MIWELTTTKKPNKTNSEQVLVWARNVEAQRGNKKEFNTMKRHEQKNNAFNNAKADRREAHLNSK